MHPSLASPMHAPAAPAGAVSAGTDAHATRAGHTRRCSTLASLVYAFAAASDIATAGGLPDVLDRFPDVPGASAGQAAAPDATRKLHSAEASAPVRAALSFDPASIPAVCMAEGCCMSQACVKAPCRRPCRVARGRSISAWYQTRTRAMLCHVQGCPGAETVADALDLLPKLGYVDEGTLLHGEKRISAARPSVMTV